VWTGRGEKKGQWELSKGRKNVAVNSEHGASRAEVHNLVEKATVPSKRVIFLFL
jgi:hypothetical protein